MTDFLNDQSRWTVLASRMETPQIIRDTLDKMMTEFIASLPKDSPALALWRSLPKPGAEAPSTPYTVDPIFTFRTTAGVGGRIDPVFHTGKPRKQ